MKEIGLLLIGAAIYFIGNYRGWISARNDFWDASVHDGKAEYYLDENNERKWRWK